MRKRTLVWGLLGSVLIAGAWGRSAMAEGGMTESKGKLYVVSGATLMRIDLKTLKVEAKADLSKLGADEKVVAEEKKRREDWIARFDTDKNGEIDGEELTKNRWMSRMDRNQDGKLTGDEVPVRSRPAPGATGAAELLVKESKLIMLRGGTVFVFDLTSLELKSSVKVSEQKATGYRTMPNIGRGRGDRGARGGDRGARGGQAPGGQAPAGPAPAGGDDAAF